MYLPTEQTSPPIDTQARTNADRTPSVSMSCKTFPNRQELPALDPDFGGSSESSLFEPTPVPTPQYDDGDYIQASETEAGIFDQDLGGTVAFEGVWDPAQGPRKYRTLAPKPPTPRPEQLPPKDQQQRLACTQTDSLGRSIPAGRHATLPLRPLRSASRMLSPTAASNIFEQDFLHQNRMTTAAGELFGDLKMPQVFDSDVITGSGHLSPDPMAAQFLQQHDFTQLHDRASVLANQSGQARRPLPAGPSSGVGSDFDALFDTSAPDTLSSNFADPAYPGVPFPILSTNETRQLVLDNFMQTPMPPASNPFYTGLVPASLPDDNAPTEEDQQLNHVDQSNGPSASSIPPIMSLTLPSEDTLDQTTFNPHNMQGSSSSVAPALPTQQDAFFQGNALQQSWHLDPGNTMPTTPYPNYYDAAYPPFEDDEPDTPFHGYSSTPDNFDFSSSPLYYHSDATRNPSLPTTPHRTDERGNRDTSMDDVLLAARAQGMTYKEIRERYGFTEAESTLRGRWRTLTKPKDERVRKPTWNLKAINALIAAVQSYADANHPSSIEFIWVDGQAFLKDPEDLKKIGWKKVAELIHAEGCYLYGNSTTKERYKEARKAALVRAGLE